MRHSSRQQPISWFQDQYRALRLVLRPPFQRKPVWSEKQRNFLIESILLNIPVPELYVQVTQAEDGAEFYGVVDGQQRIRTILQFVGIERDEDQVEGEDTNRFTLSELPENSAYKDVAFANLSSEQKKLFYQYEICVRFLYTDQQRDVEDVFKRLNKFAVPLKAQELRNATFHGPFAKLSEELADDDYWAVNRIVKPAAIRRMADIEMMSDLLIGLLHGPQGGSAAVLTSYYEQYEIYEDEFPEQTRVHRLFSKTLRTVQQLFPKIAEVPRWGNRADFYSLFLALGSLLEEHELPATQRKDLADDLAAFAKEVNQRLERTTAKTGPQARKYARAIEKGSNEKARRSIRHRALIKVIEPYLRERQ